MPRMIWDGLGHDLRYTLRTLRRDSGFFAAAVLIIGLGIGANTPMFSVVDTLLFRPLPFQSADRLVFIANTGKEGDLSSVTSRVANYRDWTRLNRFLRAFDRLLRIFRLWLLQSDRLRRSRASHRCGGGAELPQPSRHTARARPRIRHRRVQVNGTPAVILTHGLWERRFGADPHIVGRCITLNDHATTIVGVVPAAFDFSTVFTPGSRIDLLTPFPITEETDLWGNTLAVIGRLKPHVDVRQAQAEFDVVNQQIRRAHPERGTFGAQLTPLQQSLTGRFRRGLLVLLCAVGAVLLIACTNLSSLMLARATSRRKEMAVRSALGASRARLVRQMLTESLMLSFLGAALGLALAYLGIRSLSAIHGVSIPLLHTVKMDGTALLFTALAALITGLLFGIVPALQTAGSHESEALKDTGRGMSEGHGTAWTRSLLVVSEVALACVLLVGAGLLIRSFMRVLEVDLGFQPERAAAWRIDAGDKYSDDTKRAAFYDRLVRAVEAVPGVELAGITDALAS